ncbi:MAG: hypothetical protein JSW63_09395 [Ignavibacterium sp.]|nr:MAG: hypothetical protein JSW63_09395 [Ignavibacterium sp.]
MGSGMKILFFFFYALVLLGCNSSQILISEKVDAEELKKRWIHSREEEIDSIQIYRPADYKEFPPSRYRQVYSFFDDGKCEYLVLAPNDAHYSEDGTWTYNKESRLLVIFNSSHNVLRELKIISLTKDQLKFVKIK